MAIAALSSGPQPPTPISIVPATHDIYSALLRCPPGQYNHHNNNSSLARLRLHWRRLLELGYKPREASAAASRRAANRGFISYESPLWPRPPHCSAKRPPPPQSSHPKKRNRRKKRAAAGPPWPIVDEPPGTCEPHGTVCDKYRISKAFKFVWHHVWKGGTTSLSPYLSCNLQAQPVAGLLRTDLVGSADDYSGYLHVGTAREPIQRFLSAFQEVYSRVRLRAPSAYDVKSSKTDKRCHHRKVPWMLVAMGLGSSDNDDGESGCVSPNTALSDAHLKRIFRQFVADVECSTHFPNVEHLYTQSLFLGGNTSSPHPIDLLLRLETLDDDVRRLKRRVGYGSTDDKCPLKTERRSSDKPKAVPAAGRLRELFADEPDLLQSVCNVYMQDFICLGYELPKACELLPRRAAKAPKTMEVTPSTMANVREN